MVYTQDMSAVKNLLKKCGFLKPKGKQNKPKGRNSTGPRKTNTSIAGAILKTNDVKEPINNLPIPSSQNHALSTKVYKTPIKFVSPKAKTSNRIERESLLVKKTPANVSASKVPKPENLKLKDHQRPTQNISRIDEDSDEEFLIDIPQLKNNMNDQKSGIYFNKEKNFINRRPENRLKRSNEGFNLFDDELVFKTPEKRLNYQTNRSGDSNASCDEFGIRTPDSRPNSNHGDSVDSDDEFTIKLSPFQAKMLSRAFAEHQKNLNNQHRHNYKKINRPMY